MMRHFLVFAVTFASVAAVLAFIFRHGAAEHLVLESDRNGDSPSLDSRVSRYHEGEITVYRVEVKLLDLKSDFDEVVLVAGDNTVILETAYDLFDRGKVRSLQADAKSSIGSLTKPFAATVTPTDDCRMRLDQSLAHLLPFFPKQRDKKNTVHCLLLHAFNLPLSTAHREWGHEGDEFHGEHAPEE